MIRGWKQPRLQGLLGRSPSRWSPRTAAVRHRDVFDLFAGPWVRLTTDSMIAPWLGHALAGLAIVAVGKMAFLQYTP